MKFEVEKIESFTGHRDCVYNVIGGLKEGQFYSVSGDGLLVEWNTAISDIGIPVAKMNNSIYALHQNRSLLWIGENFEGLRLIDATQKKQLHSIAFNKTYIFDIKSYQDQLFVAGGDGVISIIDTEKIAFKTHIKASSASVRAIAINPVEREFAAGYSDNIIRIFDLQTFQLKQQINAHSNSVFTLGYSPDFKELISGSRDARLKVWDVENGYTLSHEIAAHMFTINHMAFSPSGKLLATCSMDKSIKLWDASSYKLLKVIDRSRHAGHATSVNRIHWLSEDRLISASDDRSISLWSIKPI
jgi:WD40 repeat protein